MNRLKRGIIPKRRLDDGDEDAEPSSSNCSDMPLKDELFGAEEHYMEPFANQSLTADLIQSAAAVMEDAPSTAVSDDEGEEEDQTSNGSSSGNLECLQTERLPAMPSLQDRKRFLGCLAAVLASLYEYDDLTEDEFSKSDEALNRYLLDMNPYEAESDVHGHYSAQIQDFEDDDQAKTFGASRGMEKAAARHRRRRYDTLSHLLMSAGEYLDLEVGQVRAFLPMLSQLLVPKPQSPSDSPNSANSRQQQETVDRASTPQQVEMMHQAGISKNVDGFTDDFLNREIDQMEHLRPFLESMTPGSGFRCVSLLLLQTVLHCSGAGYDARIRHALKTVAVLVLASENSMSEPARGRRKRRRRDVVQAATRRFESLEQHIAKTLIELAKRNEGDAKNLRPVNIAEDQGDRRRGMSRRQVMRSLKVGGTAVAAGALFAVSGGMAAPVIAGAVATLASGTAVAATAAILTSTAALTTIFGVGGGGLAAYKMQRRTKGLTEFEFTKEGHQEFEETAELFSTICISGWVRDQHDFQRPWGATPTTLDDRLEKLERFYSVHSPSHVLKCQQILTYWKDEEEDLWKLLRKKYGTDPDHLFPLQKGPRYDSALTHEQKEVVDQLFVQLGYSVSKENPVQQATPLERMRNGWRKRTATNAGPRRSLADSDCDQMYSSSEVGRSSVTSLGFESIATDVSQQPSQVSSSHDKDELRSSSKKKPPRHLQTVWDYQATYGGEHYTVRWESSLLNELCQSVNALVVDLVRGGTTELLKHTALTAVMSAVALPVVMVAAANMIDGTWTLAVERADEAGKELARSLLFSRAGHRPVTLVGYSFGARTIYSCLKELARLQEKWEDFHEDEQKALPKSSVPHTTGTSEEFNESDKNFFKYMREPASIVEDVVLMGMPNRLSLNSWKNCRRIVAGRLVNCFSQRDWILSLMFQLKRMGFKTVCGTCPVDVPGVENIDVTDLVQGHQDYCLAAGDILKRIRHCQPLRSRHTEEFVPDAPPAQTNPPEKYDL